MTHFCIALCNVLHSRYLARTAYLELNASHAVAAFSPESDLTIPFRHQGVSYYPEITIRCLAELKQLPYKYKILDFGVLTPYTLPEYVHCDYHVVLTNAGIWKTRQLEQFLQQIGKNIGKDQLKNYSFLCVGKSEKNFRRIYKAYGIRVHPVPFLENPFHISSDYFGFFENIWKGM